MPVADNDGVAIAYERTGPPDAPTVAFICGLGYGRWMWRWQVEGLADEFECLRIDNRGVGESDAPEGPYSVPTMAADVEAVLADVGVERAHLVGASMGGMIAQQHALDYDRVDRLALLCTTHGGPDAVPVPEDTLERMFQVPPDLEGGDAIRYKMRPALTDQFWQQESETIDRIVGWRLASDAPDEVRAWQAEGVTAFDTSDRLADLSAPTLVMHGERDRVLPVANGRMLAAAIDGADLRLYDEGGSHLFFIERATDVNDHLRAFLRGE